MKISNIKIHGIKSYIDENIDLSDYTVFVGENNSGKSNILFSILFFLGKEKITLNDVNNSIQDDPYVEVEFLLQSGENFNHPSEYLVNNKFKVRATVQKNKLSEKGITSNYYGYTGDTENSIKDTQLLGWKTFAKYSFGDIIYIPSVKPLSEELKFTANSSLNQLVTKNIIARIKIEDEKNSHYNKISDAINDLSTFISKGENSAIQKLKDDISSKMLDYGKVGIGFDLVPPQIDDLVKSCFRPHAEIDGLDDKLPLSSQGDGFQRSLMFSLIANLAELDSNESKTNDKQTKNDCTFYIIEEPEIFLHPNHQTYFRNKLEEISKLPNSQVIITSHSPYFINNIQTYSQIKRVYLEDLVSNVAQIDDKTIDEICFDNANLIVSAKNECKSEKVSGEELIKEIKEIEKTDHIRYLLWIDPLRANSFLSEKVILVEGPTEKAFFSFLFNNQKGPFYDNKKTVKISIIDTVGKYHMYKFARLLNKFKIKVWCMYDGDDDKCSKGISHKILNESIEKLNNDGIIHDTLRLNPDLEKYIGIKKEESMADIGIYINLENNINDCTKSKGYANIMDFVKNIIDS
ncbi:MAG: AAA family ATPase [Patescibacteria group bacterium]|nr:AAA family ATPase [Patescibacteria group bacterium]